MEALKRRIRYKVRPKPFEILDDEFLLHQRSSYHILNVREANETQG